MPRPLDPMRSFKLKVALLVGLSLAASSLAFWAGSSWPFRYALLTALLVALLVTQVVAHGMTSPLREMTAAARAMAGGDYDRQVRATSRDEVGELAVAFNQMAKDLSASDRYRRELIANVSHELRTPIAALQAVLENVVDGVTPPDEATMRTALNQSQRLGDLVAELLDLSRLDGGALPLSREVFAVQHFLVDVVEQSGLDHVQLEVSPPDLTADADPARLHQVVANLLDNAGRHSPKGVDIVVQARQLGPRGGLLLEVTDQGPGIAEDDRVRVFERFTRGGADDGGTGLGLAIARWAVELHGGTIAVVGHPPGCRIQVALPPA
ncbi:MAG: HAMP domain-containing sensor histidine kinase [Mycobacteriales bacterium]